MRKHVPIVRKDGTIKYYRNRKLHREDAPAVSRLNGDKLWYHRGMLHRLDGPAVEYANGYTVWAQNGIPHREDGPAIVYENGDKRWWCEGVPHRQDGPAIELANGTQEWWWWGEHILVKNQKEFRTTIKKRKKREKIQGIALRIDHWGSRVFYNNVPAYRSQYPHRLDGPAIEGAPCQIMLFAWYRNGQRHREGGPAISYRDGTNIYYRNNVLHRLDGPAYDDPRNHQSWHVEGENIKCKTQEEFDRLISIKAFW